MITTTVNNPEDLLISDTLVDSAHAHSFKDVANLDIKLQGLLKHNWALIKGKRDTRNYTLNDVVAVRFRYEYIMDGNKVIDFTEFIDFYDHSGGIGMTKEILEEPGNLVRLNITIRQNIVDDLRERGELLRAAAESVPEPTKSVLISIADDVDALLNRYHDEMEDFVLTGSSLLLNAINNESDQAFIDKLDRVALDGNTVKQSIVYEIT